MLHIKESRKSIQEIENLFPNIANKYKFGVLGVHNLKQKMADKGVAFDKDCLIFEVCNPHQAKKVLEANMEISTALPCRVSVYTENGKTKIATIKPTALIDAFKNPQLKLVAEEVERSLMSIIGELG